MEKNWRFEQRLDFGWYVEGRKQVQAFWLETLPSASSNSPIHQATEADLTNLLELVAGHSGELDPRDPLVHAFQGREVLTAFRMSDDLGGGHMLVVGRGSTHVRTLALEQASASMNWLVEAQNRAATVPPPPSSATPRAQEAPPRSAAEFLHAAEKGDLVTVKSEIQAGLSPDATDRDGAGALHHAARKGRHDIVQFLLKRGADPARAESNHGWTPLHFAAT